MVAGSKPNSHNLKNVGHETTRYVRNKKSEYSKVKIQGLKTDGKNRNVGGLYKNEVKNRSQPRSNLVKDETYADSHIVLNRWKNHICLLLNVHVVNFIFGI